MLRKAKFFFAVVSFFVLAWLLYASPVPEIAEELPMHREIGIGFAILGIISALAPFFILARRLMLFLCLGMLAALLFYAASRVPGDEERWTQIGFIVAGGVLALTGLVALTGAFDPAKDQPKRKESLGREFANEGASKFAKEMFGD